MEVWKVYIVEYLMLYIIHILMDPRINMQNYKIISVDKLFHG